MITIRLIAINAFLLLSMATSCVKGRLVQIQYELTTCPSKEFVLPISGLEKAITFMWLEGTTEYEYKPLSKREGREWMSPNLKAYIDFGTNCYFNVITWVSDASKGNKFDKKDALGIAQKRVDDVNQFAKTLLQHNKFELKLPPKIELITQDDIGSLEKKIPKE